ncbi:carbon-monoxide dehydrogenase medium subunit [Bradyrhizobium sp. USDA 4369]
MISCEFEYCKPDSLPALMQILTVHPEATLLAGGHALLPAMKSREIRPERLVDLSAIPELRGIRRGSGAIEIGAMVTTAEVEHSSLLKEAFPLLPEAAKVISDPLIRNRATIGGSLAQAEPSGDWPAIVLAVGGIVHLTGVAGERAVPIDDFFQLETTPAGNGLAVGRRTAVARSEVITHVSIPLVQGDVRRSYLKRMHPASGFALIGVAAALRLDRDGRCDWCRIAITGAASAAFRALQAERCLVGKSISGEIIRDASRLAGAESVEFIGDTFGSSAYRRQMLPVYVGRALSEAIDPVRV